VHAVVVRDGKWFVAECLEIAVVTQGRSLDETAEALREAVALHLEGEDAAALGLIPAPRLVLQYETSVTGGGSSA
jgi:predicted RNase H-like HicB family nuclease